MKRTRMPRARLLVHRTNADGSVTVTVELVTGSGRTLEVLKVGIYTVRGHAHAEAAISAALDALHFQVLIPPPPIIITVEYVLSA